MELLKPHDPGEDRTRRCHHHRPRSCCPTGPPTHPGQQRSPTVSITVCWWPSPRCPTRVAAVPDPRDPRGTRYPLVSMLAVAVCAVLAGACTFAAITDWVRDLDRPAWGRLGFTDRVPAATTVWRLLIRIDADVLSAVLTRWLRERATPVVVAGRWRRLELQGGDFEAFCGTNPPVADGITVVLRELVPLAQVQ